MTTLDKTHFTEVERIGILLKNRRTSAAASAAASLAGVKGPDDLPLRPEVCGCLCVCLCFIGCVGVYDYGEGEESQRDHKYYGAFICKRQTVGNTLV